MIPAPRLSQPQDRSREPSPLPILKFWNSSFNILRHHFFLDPDQAQEMTQAFFAWAFESHLFQKVRQRRGSLQQLFRTALLNFVRDSLRRARCRKRGGDLNILSLSLALEGPSMPLREDLSPEGILDREWRGWLVRRAMDAVKREYRFEGKERHCRVLEGFYEQGLTYAQLRDSLQVSVHDVGNDLKDARHRLFRTIQETIAHRVPSPDDLRRELEVLLG
jgi:DNA-directed RNA polymerase specialized sigma24 family protein